MFTAVDTQQADCCHGDAKKKKAKHKPSVQV